MLECTMATALDDTLAPPGKHILSMFVQYAPYHLKGTTWDAEKDKFADRCFDILNEYAPNFKASVIDRQVIPPPDMERLWGITGGNIMQGAMIAVEHVQLPPGGRVRGLPDAGEGAVPVRGGGPPRRRGDGGVRPERGPGDAEGPGMTRTRNDLYAVSQHVREHPGMWVRNRSLDELELLIRGYENGLATHGIEEFGTNFHRRFSDYLAGRFGWSLCQGWAVAIQRHSRAKDRGWARFFQLLDDYAAAACVRPNGASGNSQG